MSRETSPPTTAEFEQLGCDWSECVVAKQAGALVAQRVVAALGEVRQLMNDGRYTVVMVLIAEWRKAAGEER